MRIERFDPATDTEQLGACHEMYEAARPVDDPNGPPISLPAFTGWWAYGWTGTPRQTWLARESGGDMVGCYLLELPDRENTTVAGVLPLVATSRRRSGIGTALLRHAAERAARAGRTRVWGDARTDSPGAAFARARGAQPGLTEARRVLDIATVPVDELSLLRDRAQRAAAGYSVLSWQGLTPEAYLDQVAAISAAMADAPRDPGKEPQRWDRARIRAVDQRLVTVVHYYSVAARYEATGELAGLTQLGVDPELPAWGFQMLTAVTRAHRGHRLGLLIKVAMMELLAAREPQLQTIITGNSETNEHMIAINAELGYRLLDTFQSWELELSAVRQPRVGGTGG
jgi:GNAT superfamily N-acetyltransferase/RimJ/RimL family protein N-acetyltransferase